jgi:hypothetical protein
MNTVVLRRIYTLHLYQYGFEYCVILDFQLAVNLVFGISLSVCVEFFQRVHHFAFVSCVYDVHYAFHWTNLSHKECKDI